MQTESQNRELWFTLPPQQPLLVSWVFQWSLFPFWKFSMFYSSCICIYTHMQLMYNCWFQSKVMFLRIYDWWDVPFLAPTNLSFVLTISIHVLYARKPFEDANFCIKTFPYLAVWGDLTEAKLIFLIILLLINSVVLVN